ISGSFAQVEVADGVAYAANSAGISAIDLLTGQTIQTLSIPASSGLAREGSFLYATDSSGNLFRVIDLSSGSMVARGSLSLPNNAGKLLVGSSVAYVGTRAGDFSGGIMTVNVANPDAPTLISSVDNNGVAGAGIAVNGNAGAGHAVV